MSVQNSETHRQSQRTVNPTLLEPFARRCATREEAYLLTYLYWLAQELIAYRRKDVTVVLTWHPSWDAPPEYMAVPPVENRKADRKFRRFLRDEFSCTDFWFSIERGGVPVSTDISPQPYRNRWHLKRLAEQCKELVAIMHRFTDEQALKPLDDYNEIIERRFPRNRVEGMRDLVEAAPRMDRSDMIWKLGCLCAEHGCTRSEIATVVAASRAYKSKHGEWDERRLTTLVNKVTSHVERVKQEKLEKKERKNDR